MRAYLKEMRVDFTVCAVALVCALGIFVYRQGQENAVEAKNSPAETQPAATLKVEIPLRAHAAELIEDEPAAEAETTEPVEIVIEEEAVPAEVAPLGMYYLSAEQRAVVEHTVACEARGESFEGMKLVAQCIRNGAEIDGISPSEAVIKYQYADYPVEVSDQVREAVAAVFDRGEVVTEEPILFFYSPANMSDGVSEWHESLRFVISEGGHRFFALPEVEE